MAHRPTIPVPGGTGLPSPACEARETGHRTGRLSVAVDGQRVRVQTPRVSTPWLPDTPRHRHRTVVWLRLLVDEHGTPWFTWEELSVIVGRANRQAASQHLEDVRPCGADVRALVLRKRKVDAAGVEAV
jgi:hypothetical protein